MDSRLLRAIATPTIQQPAMELVRLSLRALDGLKQLDESLYERFVESRSVPEDPEIAAARMRKLWEETFRGLVELLAFCRTLIVDTPKEDEAAPLTFDFGDLEGPAPPPTRQTGELSLGSDDIGSLLEGLDETSMQDDHHRWSDVLEQIGPIEYGLSAQYADATSRLDVALAAGEINQVLGLLDDATSAAAEGVHALVTAVYVAFLPEIDPATVVPEYLTSLGRALLVRRGLAELAAKLATHNEVLQNDTAMDQHPRALAAVRHLMQGFVGSAVCRAMRAADRWQMVELERELREHKLPIARLTSEGVVKYIDSLASVNQREVLQLHDRRTIDEMREALAAARELLDLSPRVANEMLDRAYQACQRLRGRHPGTDALIKELDRPSSTNPTDSAGFLEQLEWVLAAADG